MIYGYKCESCGHTFEGSFVCEKRDVPTNEPCPSCGEEKVKRLLSAPAIVYDGVMSLQRRAGDGWNDLLGNIKKNAGRTSTIETK